MTSFYDNLSVRDKNSVNNIVYWIQERLADEVLGDRELLERKSYEVNYIKKDTIYQRYIDIKYSIESHRDYGDELLFPLMEKLLGSRFKGFIDKYKKDYPEQWSNSNLGAEWIDDIDLLIDMDLEATGDVSLGNLAFFIGKDKDFDRKITQLSKTRFKAIGKVFKKKYAIDAAIIDRKEIQINKDKISRDRYDAYLANYYTAKLSVYAIKEQINKSTIDKFFSVYKETIRDSFSYKDKVGEDRLKRITTLMKKDILKVLNSFNAHNNLAVKYGYQIMNQEEIIHHLADYMNSQTEVYEAGNKLIYISDQNFISKAIHFKTLEQEHLRFHSQK